MSDEPLPIGEPAAPGTYGRAPAGMPLPEATTLGAVTLQVGDLDRSLAFYTDILGLRVQSREDARATLGATHDGSALLRLQMRPGARPLPIGGRLGLFHFALLLPDRASLATMLAHLAERGIPLGASDHGVSEALYLRDPDGLGIELYRDRPRSAWRRLDDELVLVTEPLDLAELAAAAPAASWQGIASGTRMGHVHLHVGGLDDAGALYGDALGLHRMTWRYPGALFLGAGGYHHHLGTNVWNGPQARPPAPDEAQLLAWRMVLPSDADIRRVGAQCTNAGWRRTSAASEGVVALEDRWGITLELATAP